MAQRAPARPSSMTRRVNAGPYQLVDANVSTSTSSGGSPPQGAIVRHPTSSSGVGRMAPPHFAPVGHGSQVGAVQSLALQQQQQQHVRGENVYAQTASSSSVTNTVYVQNDPRLVQELMAARGQAAQVQVTAQRAITETISHAEATLEQSRAALQQEALAYAHEREIMSHRQVMATEAQAQLVVAGAQSEAREYASQLHVEASTHVAAQERRFAEQATALVSQASSRIASHEHESAALRQQLASLEATLASHAIESERLLHQRDIMATEMSEFQSRQLADPVPLAPLFQPSPIHIEEVHETVVEPFSPINTTGSLLVGMGLDGEELSPVKPMVGGSHRDSDDPSIPSERPRAPREAWAPPEPQGLAQTFGDDHRPLRVSSPPSRQPNPLVPSRVPPVTSPQRPATPSEPIVCRYCNHCLPTSFSKFCPECGTRQTQGLRPTPTTYVTFDQSEEPPRLPRSERLPQTLVSDLGFDDDTVPAEFARDKPWGRSSPPPAAAASYPPSDLQSIPRRDLTLGPRHPSPRRLVPRIKLREPSPLAAPRVVLPSGLAAGLGIADQEPEAVHNPQANGVSNDGFLRQDDNPNPDDDPSDSSSGSDSSNDDWSWQVPGGPSGSGGSGGPSGGPGGGDGGGPGGYGGDGGGGGPPDPGGPRGFDDLFGAMGKKDDYYDLSWSADEPLTYRSKDLVSLSIPSLPSSASQKRGFDLEVTQSFAAIDQTADDVLTRWLMVCLHPRGSPSQIFQELHLNPQGLPRLDRYLGKLVLTRNNLSSQLFGMSFATYAEHCQAQSTAAKGRVLLAMVACRFRIDKARGNVIQQIHLLNLRLESFSYDTVQAFVSKVRSCLVHIPVSELPSPTIMFNWLFEQLRRCPFLERRIEKIRDSRLNSKYRSWNYLWSCLITHLSDRHIDQNLTDFNRGLGGKAVGAPAKPSKRERRAAQAAEASAGQEEVYGAAAKGKGKGKGKDGGKKGGDKGGKGGGRDRSQSRPAGGDRGRRPPAGPQPGDPGFRISDILAKPANQRSAEEKSHLICPTLLKGGTCNNPKCEYSHSPGKLERAKKAISEGRTPAAAAQAAKAKAEPKAGAKAHAKAKADAKAKAKPKAKSQGGKVAGTIAALMGIDPSEGLRVDPEVASYPPDSGASSRHSVSSLVSSCSRFIRKACLLVNALPAFLLSSSRVGFSGPSCFGMASVASTPSQNVFELEYICDSGAGRTILSHDSLAIQGVPRGVLKHATGPASTPLMFDTGGGEKSSNKSLGLSGGAFVSTEAYILEQSPIAVSMGEVVEKHRRPFIWIPGQLPFFVSDASRVQISCPLKHRILADRIESNVPVFRDRVMIGPSQTQQAAANIPFFPAGVPEDKPEGREEPPPPEGKSEGGQPEDLDAEISVPDVPLESGDEDPSAHPFVRVRRMSKRALILESKTPQHLASHFPHNPMCEICRVSHMRQRRFARTTQASDDGLVKISAKNTCLTTDSLIMARSGNDAHRTSVSGHTSIHTIRDAWSGMPLAIPVRQRDMGSCFQNLKFFVGPSVANSRPSLLVKSDAAGEITRAVQALGWFSEASLPNTWPHNVQHEGWHATYKGVLRACLLQSGFPLDSWDLAAPFAALSLAVTHRALLLPWETDARGAPLPEHRAKSLQTCWEAHHDGQPFSCSLFPFGALCYYHSKEGHPAGPTGVTGLFVGYRLESGLRFRDVLTVIDYEKTRSRGFRQEFLLNRSISEVVFPEHGPIFPWAEAKAAALRNMSPVEPLASPAPGPLPFDNPPQDEVQSLPGVLPAPVPPPMPRFQITLDRIIQYGPTDGCDACRHPDINKRHGLECRERFRQLLVKDNLLPALDRDEPSPPPPLELPIVPEPSASSSSAGPPPGPEALVPRGTDSEDEELAALFGSDGEDTSPVLASVVVPLAVSRLQVHRLVDTAVLPSRATSGSVGFDLSSSVALSIPSYSREIVATGLQVLVPAGCYGRIAPRSGLAAKHSIDVGAGVIDPDYRGEVKVALVNNGASEFKVAVGDRIAQFILERALFTSCLEVSRLDETIRGDRGFGSSDTKASTPAAAASYPPRGSHRQRKRIRAQLALAQSSCEAPVAGIYAAIAAAEAVIEECTRSVDESSSQELLNATSATFAAIHALPVHPKPEPRPSSKLPGFGFVLDLSTDGFLSSAAKDFDGITSIESFDPASLSDKPVFELTKRLVASCPGCLLSVSLPCPDFLPDTWSKGQRKDQQSLHQRRQVFRLMLRRVVTLVDLVTASGGDVVFQMPTVSSSWLLKEIVGLQHMHNLCTAVFGGESSTVRVVCNTPRMTVHLKHLQTLARDKGYEVETEQACRTILSSRFGYMPFAPCLLAAPGVVCNPQVVETPTCAGEDPHPQQEHRHHDFVPSPFVPSSTLEPTGVSLEQLQRHIVPAAVTKLLDRREMMSNERALEAVRAEFDALVKAGTWDMHSVREKDAIAHEARSNGSKVHLAQIMPICSIKYWELSADKHKYKGRVCFRGDCVRDEVGSAAVFQELSASPTNIVDTNVTIAYGLIGDHCISCADAVRAYIQSVLGSKIPTWVLIPRELWPSSWRGKYTKPMCLLVKSLYGHPESGGWWERHLAKALLTLGGQPVEGHPSVFFFPKLRLLLTVYVDDLMLSGPSKQHDPFWRSLRATIELEDPEPIGRFLGRDHLLFDEKGVRTCVFDMEAYTMQAVALYTEHTGVSKFRVATTPFCPEGSITLEDDEAQGELSSCACSILMKILWLARLARPDLLKPVCDLASKITKWTRGDDKRVYRLVCYLHSSPHYRLSGHIGDAASTLSLRLYVDADFGGDSGSARSTSGGYLVIFGPNTFFPISWLSRRQTSTSRSATESEVVALAASLFSEAIPALILWECLLDRGVHLEIMEDNQATIRVVLKGYSAKLRHISRTHKIDISSIHEIVECEDVEIKYCVTDEQAADIFTKALAPLKWPNALTLLGITTKKS